MIPKTTVAKRGDPFEAREIRELTESRAFNVYAARIDQMIEAYRSQCESATTMDEVKQAQGALKALRVVKELPHHLIHELAQPRA